MVKFKFMAYFLLFYGIIFLNFSLIFIKKFSNNIDSFSNIFYLWVSETYGCFKKQESVNQHQPSKLFRGWGIYSDIYILAKKIFD